MDSALHFLLFVNGMLSKDCDKRFGAAHCSPSWLSEHVFGVAYAAKDSILRLSV